MTIQQQFEQRFRVSSGGVEGSAVFRWLVPAQDDADPNDADYVVILYRVDFDAEPLSPTVHNELFGSASEEAQLIMTVTRGAATEVAMLERGGTSHTFFAAA